MLDSPKKKKPRSAITRRKISEALSGKKVGARDPIINPKEAAELRKAVRQGENFKHQELIDWYRSRDTMS